MSYRATESSSTQTAEERRVEADRIIQMLIDAGVVEVQEGVLCDPFGKVTEREALFLVDTYRGGSVSVKQLWWLRDIKEKYL